MSARISTKLAIAGLVFALGGTAAAETEFTFQEAPSESQLVLAQQVINTYVEGVEAREAGNLGLAARAFRAILAVAPDHIPARRALVDLLMGAELYDAAEHHLKYLLKVDDNAEAIKRYYLVQDEIIRRDPFSLSGHFSVLPSTNVNNGTRVRYISLGGLLYENKTGYETSGYGVLLGGNGSYRMSLGQGQQLVLDGSLTVNWYEIEALQYVTGSVSLQYEVQSGDNAFTIGPYLRQTLYQPVENPSSSPDNYAIGVAVTYATQVTDADKLSFNLRYEQQFHEAENFEGNYKDAPYSSASVRLDHAVNSDLGLFASFAIQNYAPPLADRLAYTGLNLSVGASYLWSPTLRTGVTLGVGQRDYVGYYGLIGVPREDDFYSIGFNVLNTNIKVLGVSPQVSCTYKRNKSNVVTFFDYESTNCNIALIRSF